jgi:hypothetical protein
MLRYPKIDKGGRMITFKISAVNPLVYRGKVAQIFIQRSESTKRRKLSFDPNRTQLEKLLIIFEVNTPKEMENKEFQVPEQFDLTHWAFEYIIKKGHL